MVRRAQRTSIRRRAAASPRGQYSGPCGSRKRAGPPPCCRSPGTAHIGRRRAGRPATSRQPAQWPGVAADDENRQWRNPLRTQCRSAITEEDDAKVDRPREARKRRVTGEFTPGRPPEGGGRGACSGRPAASTAPVGARPAQQVTDQAGDLFTGRAERGRMVIGWRPTVRKVTGNAAPRGISRQLSLARIARMPARQVTSQPARCQYRSSTDQLSVACHK
jgi:hypothetical protein